MTRTETAGVIAHVGHLWRSSGLWDANRVSLEMVESWYAVLGKYDVDLARRAVTLLAEDGDFHRENNGFAPDPGDIARRIWDFTAPPAPERTDPDALRGPTPEERECGARRMPELRAAIRYLAGRRQMEPDE